MGKVLMLVWFEALLIYLSELYSGFVLQVARTALFQAKMILRGHRSWGLRGVVVLLESSRKSISKVCSHHEKKVRFLLSRVRDSTDSILSEFADR